MQGDGRTGTLIARSDTGQGTYAVAGPRPGKRGRWGWGVSLFLHTKHYIHRGSACYLGDELCPATRERAAVDFDSLAECSNSRKPHLALDLEPDIELSSDCSQVKYGSRILDIR